MKIKNASVILMLIGASLMQALFAHSNHPSTPPKIAIVLSGHSKHVVGLDITSQYVNGLLDKGVVPQKPVFRIITALNQQDLTTQVQTLYKQGVQFFVGPLLIDDIQVIEKALPQTNNYVLISTTLASNDVPYDNVVRFEVADKIVAPYRLSLYRQAFGLRKPIVIFDTSGWAKSRSPIFDDIALKKIQYTHPDELISIFTKQLPNATSPVILIAEDVKGSLEVLPKVANPIILGSLATFDDLSLLKNPNINHLNFYGITVDVRNMMNFPLSKAITGKILPPYIANLVNAMYFATDTIASGQTTGSIFSRVLNSATSLLDDKGQASIYSVLMVKYNQKTREWDVLRKIEQYGNRMQFNATKIETET